MDFQVGKKYKDGLGSIITIISIDQDSNSTYPVCGSRENNWDGKFEQVTFTKKGHFVDDNTPGCTDIKEEYIEEAKPIEKIEPGLLLEIGKVYKNNSGVGKLVKIVSTYESDLNGFYAFRGDDNSVYSKHGKYLPDAASMLDLVCEVTDLSGTEYAPLKVDTSMDTEDEQSFASDFEKPEKVIRMKARRKPSPELPVHDEMPVDVEPEDTHFGIPISQLNNIASPETGYPEDVNEAVVGGQLDDTMKSPDCQTIPKPSEGHYVPSVFKTLENVCYQLDLLTPSERRQLTMFLLERVKE